MGKNQNNQAAEDANAPQDTDETVDESLQSAPEPERAEGLVKMHKDGQTIHAHPTTIHDHEKNGWKVR